MHAIGQCLRYVPSPGTYILYKRPLPNCTLRWVEEFSIIKTRIFCWKEQTGDVICHVFLSNACSHHAYVSGQNADPPHQFRSSYYWGEGTNRHSTLSAVFLACAQTPNPLETVSSVYGGKILYQLSYGVMVVNNRVTVIVRLATWGQQKQAWHCRVVFSSETETLWRLSPFIKGPAKYHFSKEAGVTSWQISLYGIEHVCISISILMQKKKQQNYSKTCCSEKCLMFSNVTGIIWHWSYLISLQHHE